MTEAAHNANLTQQPAPETNKAPERRLSLLIMCRNEESRIAGAIISALPIVDQVVIYDTGSTDNTIAKALEAYPQASVHTGQFTNFVDSYNAALSHVRTSHVLIMAADEIFPSLEAAVSVLRRFETGVNMLDMVVKDYDLSGNYLGDSIKTRLFPAYKRFAGPYTHEYIPVAPTDRVELMPSIFYVRHTPGKTAEQQRVRMHSDIAVLKQYIEDNRTTIGPDYIRAFFYLHKSYTILGQRQEAKPYANVVREFLAGVQHVYVNQIDFDEADTAYRLSGDVAAWKDATTRNPWCPALQTSYGMAAKANGDYASARNAFLRAMALPRNNNTTLLSDNPALYLDYPISALAEMAHVDGDLMSARMWLNILSVVNPQQAIALKRRLEVGW